MCASIGDDYITQPEVQTQGWKRECSRGWECPLRERSSASLPLDNLLLEVGSN